ncbi:GGDEF domain-containing protein [Vibrio cincinnatiensis]|uniref:GGDEF domain-containing protein n=1 Tax=Vibrio cincinnatiensis TaxID=675 RepID=UPI001EDD3882|nr:GGDEF domain-containing protein [Vibrio cincinnatiensis]MCG3737028.1 GGDEF domain-containing protein [Vibrio cincinnatiensis]MCG3745488.1 GGDEF domain-containing protein [Vibrio cincinnatiensis]
MVTSSQHCIELNHILKNRALTPLFQPILSLSDGAIKGFEALIRGPSDSPLHSPIQLFKTALACGELEPLDMLCRELSILAFSAAQVDGQLFLNVNPLLLLTENHTSLLTKNLLEKMQLNPARIVIEISEQYQVEDPDLLIKAVQHYRQLGFKIAIDDLGSGFSGLKLWSELQPDIVKIDRYFIDGVHRDPTKKAFVQNIIRLAKTIGAMVVAEGIETEEEFSLCRELGADFAQGYLLGRPQQSLVLHHRYILPAYREPENLANDCIEQIVRDAPTVPHYRLAMDVYALFKEQPALQSMAILKKGVPVGLICRTQLEGFFAQPFGRALYEKKPINQLMNPTPVIVDASYSLDEVSRIVAEDECNASSWYFIICRKGQYLGLGSVRQLLKKVSERKLHYARYANPLTLLPGNVPIYQQIERLLREKVAFSVAYLDLNNFKPYNDIYGYSKGDLVPQMLADMIQQQVAGTGNFVGHIGGDDFVIIFHGDEAEQICQKLVAQFDDCVVNYYTSEDRQRGGIVALSRTGERCFYPLLSLSIGITFPDPELCLNYHDVAALSTAAKYEAKKLVSKAVFVSTCRGPAQLQVS